ncbi:hypothetical protein KIPB_008854 [Kipferlia bialata]|uniref:Uncharacterized protein n=1 Tax=Kipferlia bialata TaxID=797122 RepID=A0A9K3D3Z4_9EUKA|nr:hypothetical protein KIPB_008854 [Kipferlia bialata]|eukprot:g8854.t1
MAPTPPLTVLHHGTHSAIDCKPPQSFLKSKQKQRRKHESRAGRTSAFGRHSGMMASPPRYHGGYGGHNRRFTSSIMSDTLEREKSIQSVTNQLPDEEQAIFQQFIAMLTTKPPLQARDILNAAHLASLGDYSHGEVPMTSPLHPTPLPGLDATDSDRERDRQRESRLSKMPGEQRERVPSRLSGPSGALGPPRKSPKKVQRTKEDDMLAAASASAQNGYTGTMSMGSGARSINTKPHSAGAAPRITRKASEGVGQLAPMKSDKDAEREREREREKEREAERERERERERQREQDMLAAEALDRERARERERERERELEKEKQAEESSFDEISDIGEECMAEEEGERERGGEAEGEREGEEEGERDYDQTQPYSPCTVSPGEGERPVSALSELSGTLSSVEDIPDSPAYNDDFE